MTQKVVVSLRPVGDGNVRTLSTTSAQTAVVGGDMVDIVADVDCFIEIGPNPTAVVNTSYRIVAGTTYRFPLFPGDKIAGVVASGTGNLWYHPVGIL